MEIMGIKISELRRDDILVKVKEFLTKGGKHYLVTPNPEMVLEAQKDEEFFYILNKADLAVPDGVGLKLAAWCLGKNIKIYPGADLTRDILKLAAFRQWRVAVANWNKGLSQKEDIMRGLRQASWFKKNYFGARVKIFDISREDWYKEFEKLKSYHPDILFSTFGAPWQEKFIFHNLENLPSLKLAMGVGASFDYISGKARRAPRILRKLGLEWLWRLCGVLSKQKKGRKKRIWRAIIVFPYKFFKWRFILPFFYRKNVVGLLYRRSGAQYNILLVERQDEPGHWQLPQGGVDHDNLCAAGARELREEFNTDKFKIKACFKNLYKYTFPYPKTKGFSGQRPRKHAGYRGQKQGLVIAEFFGRDSDIKINFWDHSAWKWARAEDLINKVHPIRRMGTKIFLKKFQEFVKSSQIKK